MKAFIEKVHGNPCLWDENSLAYRDTFRREMCWEAVAKECGIESGKEAKLMWKRLKDSHREALRRRRLDSHIVKPWKYEKIMEFILPNYNRPSQSLEPHNDSNVGDTKTIDLPVMVKTEVSDDQEFIGMEEVLEPQARLQERVRRRRKLAIPMKVRQRRNVLSQSDGLTELFNSLCQKTRRLPKILQLQVQRDVFAAVSKAEEAALSLEVPGMHSAERGTESECDSLTSQ
ncbi:uncharacterized protein LOC105398311 [Plutella xylostella]|uniref:uncharacterized protein LOC105398311 n=1 Tax=Plutella xylostella TaxID=51655 RepID=UPI0020329334|nr:uncharacterized protein LOC105398311 [Plutella xylostella]